MSKYDELSFKDVDIIQNLCNNNGISVPKLAKLFNVTERTINKALSGKYRVKRASECDSDVNSGGGRDDGIAEEALPFTQNLPFPNFNIPNTIQERSKSRSLIESNAYLREYSLKGTLKDNIRRAALSNAAASSNWASPESKI